MFLFCILLCLVLLLLHSVGYGSDVALFARDPKTYM